MSYTPLDATTLKNSILKELGDVVNTANPGGVIHDNLDTIWGMFADKGVFDVMLQYYYAKRKAIDYLLGALYNKVDRDIGPLHLNFTNASERLEAMQKDIDGEIIERNQSMLIPIAATITRTAPIMPGDIPPLQAPPTGFIPDANDSALEGSPYIPGFLTR